MRIYSQSQHKFIETGDTQTPQNTIMSAQSGNVGTNDPNDSLKKAFAALMIANPKQITSLNAVFEKLKKPELTAAEIEAKKKKEDSERVLKQLEDFYLENKLYYGNNIKGVYANTFAPTIEPDSPASKYKAFLMSNAPYFAKASGDTGNIALQEQKQAIKPFPTTRYSKTEAIKSFSEIRKKLGLPERDYKSLTETSGIPIDTKALGVQFGGN
jgi:hypothetical protein